MVTSTSKAPIQIRMYLIYSRYVSYACIPTRTTFLENHRNAKIRVMAHYQASGAYGVTWEVITDTTAGAPWQLWRVPNEYV